MSGSKILILVAVVTLGAAFLLPDGHVRSRRGLQLRRSASELESVVSKTKQRPKDIPEQLYNDADYVLFDMPGLWKEDWSISKYDAAAIQRRYSAPLPFLRLVGRVINAGLPLLGWYATTQFDNATVHWRDDEENALLRRRRGEELRKAIIATDSVTFIKGGQAASLRPDLVKVPEWVDELTKLQDEVDSFSTAVAMDVIAEELGVSDPRDVFDFPAWPPEPVAAASIGQVYRAHLKNGAEVAIKVQRPSARASAALDMLILRNVALLLKRVKNLRSDMQGIADRFGEQLFDELDYNQEARNAQRFRELYGDIDYLEVPRVYPELTRDRVLVMEWINGTKGPWEDGRRVLSVGLQCSVAQLFEQGFFHADPHRGNLLLTPEGKLCYLDFGMMVNVTAETRFAMIGAVVGLQNKDIEMVSENLVKLEFLPDTTDLDQVVPAVESAFQKATGGKGASRLNFTTLNTELNNISYLLPFRIPPFFSTIVRTMTILEGLALTVDPDFRLVKGSYPFVAQLLLDDENDSLRKLLERTLVKPQGGLRWSRLEQLVSIAAAARSSLEDPDALRGAQQRSDLIKKYGGASAEAGPSGKAKAEEARASQEDLLDGLSIDGIVRIVEWLLSDKGAFLRRPLVQDIVDTLDSLSLAAGNALNLASLGLLPRPGEQPDRERLESIGRVLARALESDAAYSLAAQEGNSRIEILQRGVALLSNEKLREKFNPILVAALPLFNEVVVLLVERGAKRELRALVRRLDLPGVVGQVARVLDGIDENFKERREQERRSEEREKVLPKVMYPRGTSGEADGPESSSGSPR